MSITYKKVTNVISGKIEHIQKTNTDKDMISEFPLTEENADYREYLEWVEAGNPEAAAPDVDPFTPDIPMK